MASETDVDVVIVGGGVVGCAIASRLSQVRKDLSLVLVEQGPRVGEGITSRNSGVIHAGIYYPPGSLKARTCVRGNALLYEWVERTGVPFKRVGKLIVAQTEMHLKPLEDIRKNAQDSGACKIKYLSRDEVLELEPEIEVAGALLSEMTGIVDPFELTRSFLLDAEANGALALLNRKVTQISSSREGAFTVHTQLEAIRTPVVINAAGLQADQVAALAGVDQYRLYPCRGDYFRLASQKKYRHLIYPTKDPKSPGLGVHLTIDLDGSYRLGPDAEYTPSRDDFSPADGKLSAFYQAAKVLLGELQESQLSYAFCGIRPKLRGPTDSTERDFIVSLDRPGLINLVGIESPGLTASMALAEEVERLL